VQLLGAAIEQSIIEFLRVAVNLRALDVVRAASSIGADLLMISERTKCMRSSYTHMRTVHLKPDLRQISCGSSGTPGHLPRPYQCLQRTSTPMLPRTSPYQDPAGSVPLHLCCIVGHSAAGVAYCTTALPKPPPVAVLVPASRFGNQAWQRRTCPASSKRQKAF